MEYSAGSTKYLLWYIETKETARLSQVYDWEEVKRIVIEDNLYQQKSEDRLRNEFGCIQKRIASLPDELIKYFIRADVDSSKLITIIGCMASDLLFFDFMYEVYRNKVFLGEERISVGDWNIFFDNKQRQNDKVASFTEATSAKLRQTYFKMLKEAGLLIGNSEERTIKKPYVDQDIRYILQTNGMEKYLITLTGER